MKTRTITTREKRILALAAVVAVLFALSQGLPAVTQAYQQRAAVIESLKDDIARENRLIEDALMWRERREDIDFRREELEQQAFPPGTIPMLTANIQRLVRQHANQANVNITSTRLAESMEAPGWLLVEQSMSFTMGDQANTLGFLESLEQSQPYLAVTSFTLRRTRNQYAGDITVVGFSRNDTSPGLNNPLANAR